MSKVYYNTYDYIINFILSPDSLAIPKSVVINIIGMIVIVIHILRYTCSPNQKRTEIIIHR